MSKEIVITVIILIGIIGLNIGVGKYVDSKLNHVLDELSELRPLIEDEKYEEVFILICSCSTYNCKRKCYV